MMNKICIFNGDMSRGGGTERITQALANCLVSEFDVTVLNLKNSAGASYYPLDKNVHFHILKKKKLPEKILELTRFLRESRFSVLIDVDIMLGIYSLPALTFCPGTKLISWEMFNLRNDIGSKHTKLIRKICLRRSAYYVNQTKGDMEAFQREMPVHCPITYIHNPCEFDKTYIGYDQNSKVIVTAGHFYSTKGYDLAIETAKQVFSKHPDWKWHFYGDGVELERCKAKVREYALENNVIFCGRTKDIINEYKKAAMYVMTSRTEGFGLVLTEAKSCNLPTLAFDCEFGPREIIEDRISGYLVPAFDVSQMAETVCELIENTEERKSFAEHARDNLDQFSTEAFREQWIRVIRRCIS